MKKKLLVSFSGGETSAFMCDWLIKNKSEEYEMYFVFANTSKERKETLDFCRKVDIDYDLNLNYIQALFSSTKSIGYESLSFFQLDTKGEVFTKMVKAYGLPNQAYPHCTRELKTVPIHKWAKEKLGSNYYTAIGIRADEIDRVNSKWREQKIYYPLVEANISKPDVNAFWRDKEYRLELNGYEGNCDMCWKKSNRKLLTLINEKPELLQYWIDLEDKFKNYIPPHRNRENTDKPLLMFRGSTSIHDLIELSKLDFEKALDDTKNYYSQTSLFGYDLDSSNGCDESCEFV